ncbi:MAG: glycerol-3-phosphate 1-O-acyltransferase PlsY [Deltaproteobacteria bacterium]|nr:glycerol-3-phosphate 1-O-acyltransferase PlsY [Deltaproteobacteria bacterium]
MNAEQIALLFASYIGGSIPFGLMFGRIFSGRDIRESGSGNIGTANVIRNAGIPAGVLTFLCDMLKGLIPVFIGLKFFDSRVAALAGLLSVIGHIFPVFLNFKGGKGVATAFGVMLGFNYFTALLSFGVFIAILIFFRISSISSLMATVSNLILNVVFVYDRNILLLNVLLLMLIFYRHRDNIKRLLRGEEPRMWERKSKV